MNCPIALYKRSKTAALQENGLQSSESYNLLQTNLLKIHIFMTR